MTEPERTEREGVRRWWIADSGFIDGPEIGRDLSVEVIEASAVEPLVEVLRGIAEDRYANPPRVIARRAVARFSEGPSDE